MKKRSVAVVLLVVASMLFFAGCENPSSSSSSSGGSSGEDGTLTVTATGLDGASDGKLAFGVSLAGAEAITANMLALASPVDLSDVAGTDTRFAEPRDSNETWIGTGGTTYDVYIFVDLDDSNDPSDGDLLWSEWPLQYTQDGDKTITVNAD
jgi:hypothetical protein